MIFHREFEKTLHFCPHCGYHMRLGGEARLNLLFDKDSYELDEKFRDLLNIIVGTFLASFGKVVDFWFKHDKSKKPNS